MPFDARRATLAVRFFERILKHTADQYYGQPFRLAPWQRELIEQVFGNLKDDGSRQIEMVYAEVPKKAGKTELVAGLLLALLVMEQAPGAQIYGAAAGMRQAENVFRAACKMVEQSPLLQQELLIRRSTHRILKRSDPDSFYVAIAGDGDMSDGINPLCAVVDEVHRWKTRKQLENWDVLTKGGITRRQTLSIAITTAGVRDESPLAWQLHEKVRKIEQGVVSDPTFFGRIYSADPGDDISKPETWAKANPSLKQNGGFLDIEKYRIEYERAASGGDLTSFRRYFLNLWDEKANRAIDMAQWEASSGPWIARGLAPKAPEDVIRPLHRDLTSRFIERTAWAAADLSMTTDLSSLVFVFRDDQDDAYEVVPFFWLPEDGLRKREIRDGVPYRQWAEQGFLELCPGSVIDYRLIEERIKWGSRMFDLREIAFDPWNSRQISTSLIAQGYNCIEIRQGYPSLSEPSKKVLELVATGKLWHGGNPILRWNAQCASTISDGRDNIMFAKPDRKKDTARIDGIAATTMALARAMVAVDDSAAAYYRSGLMIL